MSTVKYPETISFYKKTAELQVKLKKPEADENGRILKGKEGCMFFEGAKAIEGGEGRINWDEKIIMKIGTNDIGQMLAFLVSNRENPCKLFHKNSTGAETKLDMTKGNEGSVGVRIARKMGDTVTQASLYLSAADTMILEEALKAALPITLGY